MPLRIMTALLLALACCVAPAPGQSSIVASDLLQLQSIDAVTVSPKGDCAVYVVRSIAPTESAPAGDALPQWAYRTHLWYVDLSDQDAAPRQLTFGDRRDRSPVLAPNGRDIAFVRDGDDDAGASFPQVWRLSLDGGEAQQLTELPAGAGHPVYAPSGRRLLVIAPVAIEELDGAPPWPSERPGEMRGSLAPSEEPSPDGSLPAVRAWLEQNAEAEDPSVITRLAFQGEQSLRGAMHVNHFFMVDLVRRDDAPKRITNGFFDHHDPAFMPDGRSIVYSARKQADAHPDRRQGRGIYQVNVDGTNDRPLLPLGELSYTSPMPSLDGSVLAYRVRKIDAPAFRTTHLAISAIDETGIGKVDLLTDDERFGSSVWNAKWMHARSSLVFMAPRRGGVPLYTMGMGLLEPAVLVDEVGDLPGYVTRFDVGGGRVVFAQSTMENPCRLWVAEPGGVRELHDLNPWLADRRLALATPGTIDRPDGVAVDYWLMRPTRFDATRTYPLALQIHGGPAVMWGPGEPTMWFEYQLLCAWGYGVVYSNPRGSGGYGETFRRGNEKNWGDGPGNDVLAVVDEVLLEDWVDANRLVVTGGSYGGYLTAWLLAHDQRFKAAVAQRGVYDLATFYGEGNAWELVEWAFGGPPWDARTQPILRRESPMTHVARIRTPLLIMHASNDLRTGVSQSEMLYRALKRMGRPVEYIRYPNAGHDLSRSGNPRQRIDRLLRIVEFFERFTQP